MTTRKSKVQSLEARILELERRVTELQSQLLTMASRLTPLVINTQPFVLPAPTVPTWPSYTPYVGEPLTQPTITCTGNISAAN